jgi:5-methylcytosine-specific restriction endonuclease McrA
MARYRAFIRSAMRKAWQKWPPRYAALAAAKRPYKGSNPRQKFEYQCAHCCGWFMGKEVSVDHIIPWGSIQGLSLDEAWSRLLVPIDQLQVLCGPCHDTKTGAEKRI